jgi:hypothetical protein
MRGDPKNLEILFLDSMGVPLIPNTQGVIMCNALDLLS